MSEPAPACPQVDLRAPGIRVEHRGGRLVVRSGPPALLAGVLVASLPVLLLGSMLLRSRRWEAEAMPTLLLTLAFGALAWLGVGPWKLTLDRREGWARLLRGPWPKRRALAGFVGVRFHSLRQAQIEQVRRRGTVMPYAPAGDVGSGVALVDEAGRRWRVTRGEDRFGIRPRREDAERAARLVAQYLGVPFTPPYETPPGGAVPPPLDAG